MDGTGARIERALEEALAGSGAGPPRLAAALRHAVFPGGQRLRPRLSLLVAGICGEDAPELASASAAALELLHCASLVHDDLPCFDDAAVRRGRPSVHAAFGEELAVLAGDGLIVAAFEVLARGGARHSTRVAEAVAVLARAAGAPHGLVAGQAWESEPHVDLRRYHRAKTAALFEAAARLGAIAAGASANGWAGVGQAIGEAYQVADDLLDVSGSPSRIGKPTGRDQALGRPSAVEELGAAGAAARAEDLLEEAISRAPPGAEPALRAFVDRVAERIVPAAARRRRAG